MHWVNVCLFWVYVYEHRVGPSLYFSCTYTQFLLKSCEFVPTERISNRYSSDSYSKNVSKIWKIIMKIMYGIDWKCRCYSSNWSRSTEQFCKSSTFYTCVLFTLDSVDMHYSIVLTHNSRFVNGIRKKNLLRNYSICVNEKIW